MDHTNQQLQSLLRAILDDPADDDRRLIYADALEDAGHVERAEFIRVQVALEKTPQFLDMGIFKKTPYTGASLQVGNKKWGELKDREGELLNNHGLDFILPVARIFGIPEDAGLHEGNRYRFIGTKCGKCGEHGQEVWWTWRRGFIAEVRCSSVVWIHYGPQLVREHPVEMVIDSEAVWPDWRAIVDDNSPLTLETRTVPIELRHFLVPDRWNPAGELIEYANKESAIADYSSACLKFAKSHPPI